MSTNTTKRKTAGAGEVSQKALPEQEQLMAMLQTLLVLLQRIYETTQAINTSTQEIATALRTVICEKEEHEEQAPTTKYKQRDRESGKEAASPPSFYRGQWIGPQPIILRARQQPQPQAEEEEVHS